MRVRLPSGLRSGAVVVRVDGAPVAATRAGDDVVFTLPAQAGVARAWAVSR